MNQILVPGANQITNPNPVPFTVDRIQRPAPTLNIVNTAMDTPALQDEDHAAKPIKSIHDIKTISDYLIRNYQYKDNAMFIMGINLGLRYGDLSRLRYGDIIDCNTLHYRDPFWVREQKTRRRRDAKAKEAIANGADESKYLRKPRALYINDAIVEAFELYCGNRPIDLNAYIFPTEKTKDKPAQEMKPISRRGAQDKFDKIFRNLRMDIPSGTHFMRKTYAYHFIMNAPDRYQAINYLQKTFGHSDSLTTLRYAGVTEDEIRSTVNRMNLGMTGAININPSVVYSYTFDESNCQVIDLYE